MPAMDLYCILDLATVRYSWGPERATLSALSGTGEVLATVDADPGADLRELALRALDTVLDRTRLLRVFPSDPTNRQRVRVALYNPHTAEVAVNALPATTTYSCGSPLDIPASGALGAIGDGMLMVGTKCLSQRASSRPALTRSWQAHQG